ncbi:MAG: GFA family protein [Agarilytica sp.]
MNTETQQHRASCFCGKVSFILDGSPELMAYCHCDSCRQWSAGPINEFTLWKPNALTFTQGEDLIDSYDKNADIHGGEVQSERSWCKCCGGHVFTKHPGMGLIDVPAVLIKALDFEPAFHVHYQESILPITDGLPKFKDLPEPAGGSGEQLGES